MGVAGVGGSTSNQYNFDEVEKNGTTNGQGTDGADGTKGKDGAGAAAGAEGAGAAKGAEGAGAAKGAEGAGKTEEVQPFALLREGDDDKVEPKIQKPSPDFNISIAVAGLSDMAALLKDLSALLAKMKHDNSEASFQSAMANVASLKADAALIKDNATKQLALAITSAAITFAGDLASGLSQLDSAGKSFENYGYKKEAKAAKEAGDLELAQQFKDQIKENERDMGTFEGYADIGKASAKFVSGIFDACAKFEDSKTNAALKESEAYRAQNDAAAKVIDQLFSSIDDLIKKVADVMSDVSKTTAETRRSILG